MSECNADLILGNAQVATAASSFPYGKFVIFWTGQFEFKDTIDVNCGVDNLSDDVAHCPPEQHFPFSARETDDHICPASCKVEIGEKRQENSCITIPVFMQESAVTWDSKTLEGKVSPEAYAARSEPSNSPNGPVEVWK